MGEFDDLIPKNEFADLIPKPVEKKSFFGKVKDAYQGNIPMSPETEKARKLILGNDALDVGKVPEIAGSTLGMAARSTVPGMALSALGAGGGEAYHQIGQHLIDSPERPQSSTEALSRIGGASARGAGAELFNRSIISPAMNAASKLISNITERYGNFFLKTSPKVGKYEIGQGAKVGGDEMTTGGRFMDSPLPARSREGTLSEIGKGIEDLESAAQATVNDAITAIESQGGGTPVIMRSSVVNRAKEILSPKFVTGTRGEQEATVNKTLDGFLNNGSKGMDIREANMNKKALYSSIGDPAYYKQNHGSQIEAEMAIARALREEIEKYVPQVAPINKMEGQLLDFHDALVPTVQKQSGNFITQDILGSGAERLSNLAMRGLRQAGRIVPSAITSGATPTADYALQKLDERKKRFAEALLKSRQ